MSPLIKNLLAIIAGWVIGAAVNMGLILVGQTVIPEPEGIDPANMESFKENFHLFEPKHFLFPFLAHALGTLVGAYVATKIAASYQRNIALGIGFLFLLGGISMVMMVPSPTWFTLLDLVVAYIPMAFLGYKLAGGRKESV